MYSVHSYQGAASSGVRDRAALGYTSDVARLGVTDRATLEYIEDAGLAVCVCVCVCVCVQLHVQGVVPL